MNHWKYEIELKKSNNWMSLEFEFEFPDLEINFKIEYFLIYTYFLNNFELKVKFVGLINALKCFLYTLAKSFFLI